MDGRAAQAVCQGGNGAWCRHRRAQGHHDGVAFLRFQSPSRPLIQSDSPILFVFELTIIQSVHLAAVLLAVKVLHIFWPDNCANASWTWLTCTYVVGAQSMNVEGLTRENVASHLQKYRLQLKRGHD